MAGYQSPAAAFSNTLEDALLRREARKRQDLLDQHKIRLDEADLKLQQEALDERRKEREERDADRKEAAEDKATERQKADYIREKGDMVPGDIPSAEFLAKAERFDGARSFPKPPASLPGIAAVPLRFAGNSPEPSAQVGMTPRSDPSVRPNLGTAPQRIAATQNAAQQTFIAGRPESERPSLEADRIGLRLAPTPVAKKYEVKVPGPNGPVSKLVSEAEMEAGVREYQEPRQPTAASQSRSWIVRNKIPMKVTDAEIQPGDMPFSAARSTGDTASDRQRNARLRAAKGFLGKLDTLREKINTKMGPEAGVTGLVRRGAAKIGLDTDVAVYEKERKAGGRALAVAIMGAQNLSNADADAWADMLPGATVDRETAKTLMADIETMLDDAGASQDMGGGEAEPETKIIQAGPYKGKKSTRQPNGSWKVEM